MRAACPTAIHRDPGVRKVDQMPAFDGTWRAEAGDPPEHAQDNPPSLPGGSISFLAPHPGPLPSRGEGRLVRFIPPGLIVVVLLVLVVSQLCYALLPFRRRADLR